MERATIAIGRVSFEGGEQQRLESRMEELDVADADGADRIAMIGQLQMEKRLSWGLPRGVVAASTGLPF